MFAVLIYKALKGTQCRQWLLYWFISPICVLLFTESKTQSLLIQTLFRPNCFPLLRCSSLCFLYVALNGKKKSKMLILANIGDTLVNYLFFFLSILVFCIYACNTCECGPFFWVVKPKSAEFKLLKLNTWLCVSYRIYVPFMMLCAM